MADFDYILAGILKGAGGGMTAYAKGRRKTEQEAYRRAIEEMERKEREEESEREYKLSQWREERLQKAAGRQATAFEMGLPEARAEMQRHVPLGQAGISVAQAGRQIGEQREARKAKFGEELTRAQIEATKALGEYRGRMPRELAGAGAAGMSAKELESLINTVEDNIHGEMVRTQQLRTKWGYAMPDKEGKGGPEYQDEIDGIEEYNDARGNLADLRARLAELKAMRRGVSRGANLSDVMAVYEKNTRQFNAQTRDWLKKVESWKGDLNDLLARFMNPELQENMRKNRVNRNAIEIAIRSRMRTDRGKRK